MHTHTHACTHTYTHKHTCMHTHTHTRMHACMHTHTHTRTHARTHANTQTQNDSQRKEKSWESGHEPEPQTDRWCAWPDQAAWWGTAWCSSRAAHPWWSTHRPRSQPRNWWTRSPPLPAPVKTPTSWHHCLSTLHTQPVSPLAIGSEWTVNYSGSPQDGEIPSSVNTHSKLFPYRKLSSVNTHSKLFSYRKLSSVNTHSKLFSDRKLVFSQHTFKTLLRQKTCLQSTHIQNSSHTEN